MLRERKLRALRRVLGDEQITKGDEVVFFCHRHSHPKPKLSVNLRTDRFHCWICDFSGKNLVPILRLERGSQEFREYLEEIEGPREKQIEPVRKYDSPVLPLEFRTLTRSWKSPYYSSAMSYLKGRGVSENDILRMKLGYCEEGAYQYRIIVPSFDEFGELNFFVGRAFFSRAGLSYKHGNFDKDVIFNDYMVDWSRPVTITEGPFDALKAGENAISLLGSILRRNSKLFKKIVLSGVEAYFAMDTDAFEKQLSIISSLNAYGVVCRYVNLDGRKDVGEMTKEEFNEKMSRAIKVEDDLDVMKLRVMSA